MNGLLDRKQLFKDSEWDHGQEHVHIPRRQWKKLECVDLAIAGEKTRKKPEPVSHASRAAFVRAVRTAMRASLLAQEGDRIQKEADLRAFTVLQKVVDLTTELFGKNVQIASDFDPEYPDDKYTVFTVEVAGSSDEIMRTEGEWARRVNSLVKGVDSFQLSIRVKP